MTARLRRCLLSLFGLTLAACASGDRITSACVIELEHVADLGEIDDPVSITSTDFVSVAHVAGLGWVVLDRWGSAQPLIYHTEGRFQGLLGKVGPGPMEFSRPEVVAVDPFDSLWVSDTRNLIIMDRAGVPARSIRLTGDYRADGFDSQGRPYSVRARRPPVAERGIPPLPYIVHLSRDGVPVDSSGPGLGTDAEPRTVVVPGRSVALLDDSTIVTTLRIVDGKVWLHRWSGVESVPWVSTTDIMAALGESGPLPGVERLGNAGVYTDGGGGIWNMAALRAGPGEEWSGRLFHLTGEGEVSGVATFEGYPLDFIDREHLASTYEDPDTGLIIIRIYRFGRSCGD